MKVKQLVKGSILSESSFFVVQSIDRSTVTVSDEMGNEIILSNKYVEDIISSADQYTDSVPLTMTELADVFINSPRIAMTVCFITKGKSKTKKAYEEEVKAAVQLCENAKVSELSKLLTNLVTNPISMDIPGDIRVMKGRHYSNKDDLGRVSFIDMEIKRDLAKNYDTRTRQVDPRTIQYIIVNNIKYVLKK